MVYNTFLVKLKRMVVKPVIRFQMEVTDEEIFFRRHRHKTIRILRRFDTSLNSEDEVPISVPSEIRNTVIEILGGSFFIEILEH